MDLYSLKSEIDFLKAVHREEMEAFDRMISTLDTLIATLQKANENLKDAQESL